MSSLATAVCASARPVSAVKTSRRITAAPVRPRRAVRAAAGSAGREAVGSWLDLASFVASAGKSGGHTAFDGLADKIGRDVYIDVAGWHLYLKDVKVGQGVSLAQALAAQLGPQLESQGYREADVMALLKKVPIKLGGGQVTLALADVVPAGCARDLERACEDWIRDS